MGIRLHESEIRILVIDNEYWRLRYLSALLTGDFWMHPDYAQTAAEADAYMLDAVTREHPYHIVLINNGLFSNLTSNEHFNSLVNLLTSRNAEAITLDVCETGETELGRPTDTASAVRVYGRGKLEHKVNDAINALVQGAPLIVMPQADDVIQMCDQFEQLLRRESIGHSELVSLNSRQFEELVADLWSRFGFVVELTRRTRDGGRDVIAIRRAESKLKILIECKKYQLSDRIGISLVRNLYGVKVHEGASKAILATTSSFTAPAQQFFDAHQWELEGRDYEGVINWIQQVQRKSRGI